MPIGDLSGAVSNYQRAQAARGAVGAQRKATITEGVGNLGRSAADMVAKKKMMDALAAEGLDPNLIEAGPHAAFSAILQSRQQKQQQANRAEDRTWQTEDRTQGREWAVSDRAEDRQNKLADVASERQYEGGIRAEDRQNFLGDRSHSEGRADTQRAESRGWDLADQEKQFEQAKQLRQTPTYSDQNPTLAAPTGPDQPIPPRTARMLESQMKLPANALDGVTFREWDAMKQDPQEEMLKQLRIIAEQRNQSEHQPPSPADAFERSLSPEDAIEYKRLQALALPARTFNGEMRPANPKAEQALKDFIAARKTKTPPVAPPADAPSQPPGDPAKVKALQDAGWTWTGKEWKEPAPK